MSDTKMGPEADEAEPIGGGQTANARTPPYISFQTLLTFLSELKTNGLPPQIDKSVLRRFSGGVQNQLKMAIRSMGLVEGAKPTPELAALVTAFETPEFERLLADRLRATYPYVFELDLMTATPTMFADSFKATGSKEDVLRKCRTFFLHAAKRAGIPLGQRLLTGSAPRPAASGSRRRSRSTKSPAPNGADTTPSPAAHTTVTNGAGARQSRFMSDLLAKFPKFDPSWPDDIKAKWFEGFQQFMGHATQEGDAGPKTQAAETD
jgi:hypothetical protein